MSLLNCSECRKLFSTGYNLRKHIRNVHPDKANILAPKKTYNYHCEHCNRNFNHLKHLKHHKKKHEPVPPAALPKNKKCPLCDYCGRQFKELIDHFTQEHEIEMRVSTHNFESVEDFKTWKEKIENETNAHFIKLRGAAVINSRQNVHYVCHRSGTFVSKSKGLRNLKNQGSNKINGFCPGSLKVKTDQSGSYEVTFFETHVGHENDVNYLWLRSCEKEIIAAKIAQKVPFSVILEEVRNSLQESGRIQRLTRKDLHNIKQAYLKQRRVQPKKTQPSIQLEEEEFFLGFENDSSSVVDTMELLPEVTNLSAELSSQSVSSLGEEKEKLIASVVQVINSINTMDELESCKKLVEDLLSNLHSKNSEKEKICEPMSQEGDSQELLCISTEGTTLNSIIYTVDNTLIQVLPYDDHDYAHSSDESIYNVQLQIEPLENLQST